jgi:hypothetical protein
MSSYIRESFSTRHMLALVWLLASMSPNVNSESTPLDEALAAARGHTGVGTLICVYAIMSLKVRLAVKALGYHISGLVHPITSTSHLVACLPITLKGSRIRLILYQFHNIHPVIPPSVSLGVRLAAIAAPRLYRCTLGCGSVSGGTGTTCDSCAQADV